jgi:nucleoside 2-deoxyribosyltransferase
MKVYVAARFKGADNKQEIEALCKAVRDAKLKDFCFIRDIEHYKHTFDDPKELWDRAYHELRACDALLIDVSDYPTGGRLVETGMAYALRKPVIVTKKRGVQHKGLFDGIGDTMIEYDDYPDLSHQLKKYDDGRNFTVVDRSMVFAAFLAVGAVISWYLSQLFIPLAALGAIVYWLLARWLYAPLRDFDRIVIYIPLVIVWLTVFYLLLPFYLPLALAWALLYWVVTLIILDKLKLSL